MIDYSKLSDFEIDKAVADALGLKYEIAVMFVNPVDKVNGKHTEEYIRQKITNNEKHWKRFSPVNIPNNAWSIIVENGISLISLNGKYRAHDFKYMSEHANPLRAAMIVFLMMQENNHD